MPTPPKTQTDRIIIDHMALIMHTTSLESHDYITGEKRGLYVGRKPAGEFTVGERWYYEYEGETARSISSKLCVKHARKYVYFAQRMEDAGNPSRVTKVDKTRVIEYSLGHAVFQIEPPRAPAPLTRHEPVAVAPVAVAPVAVAPPVAQPTSDTCPVCLTDYDLKDMAETACHHNFCDACAMKLLRTGQASCPMCRTALQFLVGARA